jgi:Glycosyltransferase family 28 C-terminal domain
VKILVAPLDWGLGHATRCVPLIRGFQAEGHEVFLAGNGRSGLWLRQHFPSLPYLDDIPGMEITYPTGGSIPWHLFKQNRRMLKVVHAEHQWLKDKLNSQAFDLVVSDNRYGLHSLHTRCVIISHQLFPIVPWPIKRRVHRLIADWTARFSEIWIPDIENIEASFSGTLSHGRFRSPLKYIGPLSRFDRPVVSPVKDIDVFASISGPEPVRSAFENKVVGICESLQLTAHIACGTPETDTQSAGGSIVCSPDLSDEAYAQLIASSKLVICRSGYSTLMDLHQLGTKALLVPTPGQSEQEYLANWWNHKHGFVTCTQEELTASLVSSLLTR